MVLTKSIIRNKIKIGVNLNRLVHSLTVEKLVETFKPYHSPNYFEYIAKKNSLLLRIPRASLLIPISFKKETNGDLTSYFTLSKRTNQMRHYSDQNCFIGGKQDPTDENELQAVLREAYEEGE